MTNRIEPFVMVVDSRNSALDLVARERSKMLDIEICYATDFVSPNVLLDYLLASDKTRILFAWRGALREALEVRSSAKRYKELLEVKTVHMLVPDLLGTNPEFLTSEARLVNITHGYWVTSNELRRIYALLFPQKIPTGVLHDIPDTTLILRIRDMKLRRSGIIWVGNSRWGSNYGYVDHKGYEEVVKPLLRKNIPLTPFRIRDSSVGRAPNAQVLVEIAESEILIQASLHEGTGLPLLEALGVGTVPITSDVGIANEVLTGELKHLIVERSADSFEQKIRELGASAHHLSNLCFSAYDFYVENARREIINWDRRETTFDEYERNFLVAAKMRLIWIYRFLRSKRNR
jgi:hypothetical protein